MPFKDHKRRNEYFRHYMQRRRARLAEVSELNPGLNTTQPFMEIPRPFPLSALAEQNGKLYDLATGRLYDDTR
jgi:hypothetical protein